MRSEDHHGKKSQNSNPTNKRSCIEYNNNTQLKKEGNEDDCPKSIFKMVFFKFIILISQGASRASIKTLRPPSHIGRVLGSWPLNSFLVAIVCHSQIDIEEKCLKNVLLHGFSAKFVARLPRA